MFRVRQSGIRELQMQMSRGLIACGVIVADRARDNIHPYWLTGAAEESIHVVDRHAYSWPNPAVFVAGASGDTYFIEMGTVHSPARLFLTQALDSTEREFPNLMRRGK